GMSSALGQPLYSSLSPSSSNLIGGSSSGMSGLRGGAGGTTGMGGTTAQTGVSLGAIAVVNGNTLAVPLPAGSAPIGPAAGGPVVPPLNPLVRPAVQLAALPARMQEDLQGLVSRADVAPTTRVGLTFGLDQAGTVVLRGAAANVTEARTIESLIRFAPGIRAVR